MANPQKVNIPVPETKYHLEVPFTKRDCRDARSHCYVYDSSKYIAKVWIASCLFDKHYPEIHYLDQNCILKTVDLFSDELWCAYEHNAKYGLD